MFIRLNIECETCEGHSDCPGDRVGCFFVNGRCFLCVFSADEVAKKACVPTTPTPVASPSGVNDSTSKNTTGMPCIATSWLRKRGLQHAAIRHGGVANVLCIPGTSLPCGTPGHILRECTRERRECKFLTYREVCERRLDCINSATAVSQLSHTFEWSQFKAVAEGTSLELTSLSAHPLSGLSSPSRIIAQVVHGLNSMGLGSLCNAVILLPHRLRTAFESELVRGSS